jgi:leucine dehydrogenase
MSLFDHREFVEHEQVSYFHDPVSGLKSIIAIHDTTLGPALGGCRLWPYASDEEALTDVLRLSRGMTYKAAIAGLNLGGGKSVIIAKPTDKGEALFRAFGRCVASLGGRYITAEDVNTTVDDMEYIHQETDDVVGLRTEQGGSGDPSPFTAWGTFQALKAALVRVFGTTDFQGRSVAIQGVGHVGHHLARMLRDEGAHVTATDVDNDRLQQTAEIVPDLETVKPDEIYDVKADIFAPCALGASINEKTIPRLRCRIVGGSANNQLATTECGTELGRRNILYVPDYAANAGGLINVAYELEGYERSRAERHVGRIYDIMTRIFNYAQEQSIPTWLAADRLAEARITALRGLRPRYLPPHARAARTRRLAPAGSSERPSFL